jgi:molecular chaperone GrpE
MNDEDLTDARRGAGDERGAATDTASSAGAGGEERAEAGDGVEALRRQLEDKHDQLMRALAEMDNLRRRTRREREEYTRYAVETLLRDLVPVLDNLDRALEAARGGASAPGAASIVQGVELTQRELLRVLERAGLTRYSALGQRFDPTRHEATARVVSPDQAPDTVVGEIVPGYLLHDRVLRAAQVAVAVAPDEDAA